MSEVQQHLAAIDEICKQASFQLAEIAFRIVRCPEVASRITMTEWKLLFNSSLEGLVSYSDSVKNTVAEVQQRGN